MNAADIDFVILAMEFDPDKEEVVFIEKSDPSGATSFEYRFEILRHISEGQIYYTGRLNGEGVVAEDRLFAVKADSGAFLRTDNAPVAGDSLPGVPAI